MVAVSCTLLKFVSGVLPMFYTLKFVYLRIACTLVYALRWKGTDVPLLHMGTWRKLFYRSPRNECNTFLGGRL